MGAQSRERVMLAWALGSLEKEFGRAQDECSPRGKECQQSSTVCAKGITSAGGLRGGGAKRQVWRGGRVVEIVRVQTQTAWVQFPILSLNSGVTLGKLLNHSMFQFPHQ